MKIKNVGRDVRRIGLTGPEGSKRFVDSLHASLEGPVRITPNGKNSAHAREVKVRRPVADPTQDKHRRRGDRDRRRLKRAGDGNGDLHYARKDS